MIGYELEPRELVEEVKWDSITAIGSDCEGADDRPDKDELEGNLDDHELEMYYWLHGHR